MRTAIYEKSRKLLYPVLELLMLGTYFFVKDKWIMLHELRWDGGFEKVFFSSVFIIQIWSLGDLDTKKAKTPAAESTPLFPIGRWSFWRLNFHLGLEFN
jgi:hypothetical protein